MAASGPHITFVPSGATFNNVTFARGGVINANGVSSGTIKMSDAAKRANRSFAKLERVANYCNDRRGGPASKVFCEVPKGVPHNIHAGRSIENRSGRWYSWKDN